MAVKSLFLKAARLGPLSLGAIAVAVMILGVYLQIGENARAAQGEAVGIAGMTVFGLLSKIACGIGLIALVKVVISSGETRDAGTDLEAAPDAAPIVPERQVETSAPSYLAKPEPAYTPEPTQNFDDLEDVQPRKGFSLRKALIFLIGGAFFVMLGSVVWDLLPAADSTQNSAAQVSIPTAQERVAQSTADAIVPDADPNRSWTDIDVTPVVEWFVAKFYLALAGDADAQMLLGMIVGGVLLALFLLKFYFRLRRAMQPRTTPRIGSMGLN